jgi:hypothetical protein
MCLILICGDGFAQTMGNNFGFQMILSEYLEISVNHQ